MVENHATLKARILSKLDRKGFYCPKAVRVDTVPNIVAHEGDASVVRDCVVDMAEAGGVPLRYRDPSAPTVCLVPGSNERVFEAIHSLDPNEAEAGQGDDLRIIRG